MDEPQKPKYWCFLSYRHLDNKEQGRQWATWLQHALETYEMPADLVGATNDRGEVIPERIFPVFRDEDELPADAHLTRPIEAALRQSRILIVLCSPRARESRYVNDEIWTFKKLGKSDNILAAILDGEPNASGRNSAEEAQKECFPEALRSNADPAGNMEPTQPVAADFRLSTGSQGWTSPVAYRAALKGPESAQADRLIAAYFERQHLMLLKIIAGVIGVSLGVLTKRDQVYQMERQKRSARILRRWLLALGALTALTIASTVWAWTKQQAEAAALGRATQAQQLAETRRGEALAAELKIRLQSSKADADTALNLTQNGQAARAFAHAVRALELDPDNGLAGMLAYRLLTDRIIEIPNDVAMFDGPVQTLAFSADGRNLAIVSDSGSVEVLNQASGSRIVLDEKVGAGPYTLAFSPDGNSVAIGSTDLLIWDITKNSVSRPEVEFFYDVLELTWPIPSRIVIHTGRDWGTGFFITQVLAQTGSSWKSIYGIGNSTRDEFKAPKSYTECDHFSTWVAPGTGTLVTWRADIGQISWTDLTTIGHDGSSPPAMLLAGQHEPIEKPFFESSFAWERETRWELPSQIYIGGRNSLAYFETSAGLRVADPRTLAVSAIDATEAFRIRGMSPDGTKFLFEGADSILVRNKPDGEPIRHVYNSKEFLAVSADMATWVTKDGQNGVMIRTERKGPSAGQSVRLEVPASLLSAAMDRSGSWLALSSSDNAVRTWYLPILLRPPGALLSASKIPPFAEPQSKKQNPDQAPALVFENGSVFRTDAHGKTRTLLCTLEDFIQPRNSSETEAEEEEMVTDNVFSPDGERLVRTFGSFSSRPDACEPSEAKLYDTATGKLVCEPMKHNDDVFCPVFAPDGSWFITMCDDGTIHRWDARTGKALGEPYRLSQGQVRRASFSPDGKCILTENGVLLDSAGWRMIGALPPDHGSHEGFFAPNETWFITTSLMASTFEVDEVGNFVTVWDFRSQMPIGASIQVSETDQAHWLTIGKNLALSNGMTFEISAGIEARELLPLYRSCRPMLFDEAGEIVINPTYSRRHSRPGLSPISQPLADRLGVSGPELFDNSGKAPLKSEKSTNSGERFSETRKLLLDEEAVRGMDPSDIQFAINEMFARHGATFGDKRVQQHFDSLEWYHPNPSVSFDDIEATKFSDVERHNLKLLGALRERAR